MLWFLLFGAVGYFAYRLYKRRWFRSLQREIAQFRDVHYGKLPSSEKQKLRDLVNSIFNSGMTLDEETNQIVSTLYQEIEREDFYHQGGLGLSEIGVSRKTHPSSQSIK